MHICVIGLNALSQIYRCQTDPGDTKQFCLVIRHADYWWSYAYYSGLSSHSNKHFPSRTTTNWLISTYRQSQKPVLLVTQWWFHIIHTVCENDISHWSWHGCRIDGPWLHEIFSGNVITRVTVGGLLKYKHWQNYIISRSCGTCSWLWSFYRYLNATWYANRSVRKRFIVVFGCSI